MNFNRMIRKIQGNAMLSARKKKLDHFFSFYKEGMTVLDVGVNSEKKNYRGAAALNYFLRNYPYSSKYYTGLAIQDISEMDKLYPGKKFVQYPGDIFPFHDNTFDWVFSNAVIEHVGDEKSQIKFLNEMLRVSSNVFFTTPNKYFPIEPHFQLLFLHWNDKLFKNWRQKNGKNNPLFLLSKQKIKNILNHSNASNYEIYNNYFGLFPIPMTFTVICSKVY